MKELSNDLLIEAYLNAKHLQLENVFIGLIQAELKNRVLTEEERALVKQVDKKLQGSLA